MKSIRFAVCLIAALFLLPIQSAPAQTAHFSGVVSTLLSGYTPSGVAVDLYGNVFIADSSAGTVDEFVAVSGKVSSSSTVVTVSGFSRPEGIAVDSNGNVFVADAGNNAMKEIEASNGQISSISTIIDVKGFSNPTGVAVDSSGNVLVADTGNNAVKKIVANRNKIISPGSTVVAIGEGFSAPMGLALDSSGDVFVADSGNNAVKEIVAISGVVSSISTVNVVGNGFTAPGSVALDLAGNLFVTEKSAIKEILSSNGSFSADSVVVAVGIGISKPSGIVVDGKENVFVGDSGDQAIDEVQLGSGDFGNVDVGKTSSTVLVPFTFDSAGKLGSWTVLTQGAMGLDFNEVASGTTCSKTNDYSAGDTCSVAVSLSPQHPGWRLGAVQLFDSSGNVLATSNLQGTGIGPQAVFPPGTQTTVANCGNSTSLAIDAAGNIFVADGAVREILAAGGYTTTKTLGTGIGGAVNLALDAADNVFVADSGDWTVKEILAAGGYTTVRTLRRDYFMPNSVTVDGSDNVFFAENGSITEMMAASGYTTTRSVANGVGAGTIALDETGDLYFFGSYYALNEIESVNGVIPASPTIKTLYNSSKMLASLAVDTVGNLFVSEYDPGARYSVLTGAVLEIPATGGYTSVITLASKLGWPMGLAVDGSGSVFFVNEVEFVPTVLTELNDLTPPSLTYGPVPVGSAGNQEITLRNNGNADLIFPVPASGNNPAVSNGFELDSTTNCPEVTSSSTAATLPSGATCVYAVDFAPLATQSYSGFLAITDNSLNASPAVTQHIPLLGEELHLVFTTPPPATLPVILNPGTVLVSVQDANNNAVLTSSATITLAVTGPNNYDKVYTAAVSGGTATFRNLPTFSVLGAYTYTASDDSYDAQAAVTESVVSQFHLAFTTPPPAALQVGQNPGTVVVSVENLNNQVVTSFSSIVSLTVNGTTYTSTASSGVATFRSIPPFNNTGTYSFIASYTPDSYVPAVATEAVYLTYRLVFTTPPPATLQEGQTAGTVVLNVENMKNEVVTSFDGPWISLTVSGPSYWAQSGARASNGTVTFNNLYPVLRCGTITYTVAGVKDPLFPAVATVTIPPFQPHLAFDLPLPALLQTGQNPSAVRVSVVDGYGSVISGETPAITLTVTGPNGYNTAYTATASSGTATFSGLPPISKIGAYTYTASDTKDGFPQAVFPLTVYTNPPVGYLGSAYDSVTGSTTVSQSDSVFVRGWVADPRDGAPMKNVQVYIDGNPVGTPTLGIPRPDVAAAQNNNAYLNSGYQLLYSVASLSLGSHQVTVVATDSAGASTTFGPQAFTVAAVTGPFGHLDQARDNITFSATVAQSNSVEVSGWAVDPQDGAPVSKVEVFLDGTSIGLATLGISRPPVAQSLNNKKYLLSGFELLYPAAALSLGQHVISATATNSKGISTTFIPVNITVSAAPADSAPYGSIGAAVDNRTGSSTVSRADSLLVIGWVVDVKDGAPLSNVTVYLDQTSLGKPVLGIARPDVAKALNQPAYLNSGFQLVYPASSFSVGPHVVSVIAVDSGGRATTLGMDTITVQ